MKTEAPPIRLLLRFYFAGMIAFSGAWPYLKPYAPFFLLFLAALAAVLFMTERSSRPYDRTVRPLLLMCGLIGLYAAGSLVRIWPQSYTAMFSEGAIFRQAAALLGFCCCFMVALRFWRAVPREAEGTLFAFFGALVAILTYLTYGHTVFGAPFFNGSLFVMVAFGWWIIRLGGCVGLAILIGVAASASTLYGFSAQGLAGIALLGIILFAPARMLTSPGTIRTGKALLLLCPAFALLFSDLFMSLDTNGQIRLLFWTDAIKALFDSGGFGVGFGNEFLHSRFYDNEAWILTSRDDENLAYIGPHNSFLGIAFRMGLFGVALLAYWSWIVYTPPMQADRRQLRFLTWLYAILMLSLALNVAVESLNLSFATAFFFAYVAERSHRIAALPPPYPVRPRHFIPNYNFRAQMRHLP